jgi:hypothetical protein
LLTSCIQRNGPTKFVLLLKLDISVSIVSMQDWDNRNFGWKNCVGDG